MEVAFNLARRTVWIGKFMREVGHPSNHFYYNRKYAAQKHRQVPVLASVEGLSSASLCVARVTFFPDEMGPEFRIRTMDAIVIMCEIKWAEIYGK